MATDSATSKCVRQLKRCARDGCGKTAKAGGLCIGHGGGRKCSVGDCTTTAVSRGLCIVHGGGRRCKITGCPKSAQAGGACWAHGGGAKCRYDGCIKRVQANGLCVAHGGIRNRSRRQQELREIDNAPSVTEGRRRTTEAAMPTSGSVSSEEIRESTFTRTLNEPSSVVTYHQSLELRPSTWSHGSSIRVSTSPLTHRPTFPSRCRSWPYTACREGMCAVPSCPCFAKVEGYCLVHYHGSFER